MRQLLLLLLWVVAGCSATVVPPVAPVDPVPVALVDYGRHASLLLPTTTGNASVEYAFGDWNWFAAGRNTPSDALAALFASGQATLGRNTFAIPPDSPDLRKTLQAHRVMTFACPEDRVAVLREELGRRFEARADEQVFNSKMNLYLVPDDEEYRLWHNCNHVTARWLRKLGCEVTGSTMTSNFRLAAP
jgi:hypothetical protein